VNLVSVKEKPGQKVLSGSLQDDFVGNTPDSVTLARRPFVTGKLQ